MIARDLEPSLESAPVETLQSCSRCGGFMGSNAEVCPHCAAERPRRRRWAVALGLVGSASLGLTMMACYGAPPCEPGTNGCKTPQDTTKDSTVDSGVSD